MHKLFKTIQKLPKNFLDIKNVIYEEHFYCAKILK